MDLSTLALFHSVSIEPSTSKYILASQSATVNYPPNPVIMAQGSGDGLESDPVEDNFDVN